MESRFKSLGNVFAYSFRDGSIREYKGELLHADEDRSGKYIQRERTIVNIYGKDGEVLKYLNCAEYEGVVYNNIVWLRESNIKKAANVFIKLENRKIDELIDKIEEYKNKIILLERYMEDSDEN